MFFKGKSPKAERCCGCVACKQICGHNAISMTKDEEGFIMPQVNIEKCVECGLCEKVCPIINYDKVISGQSGIAYAAVYRDKEDLMSSSSGGIFSAIANYVLERNGVVYGASFDKNMQLHHHVVESSSELSKLRGSKYLQSSTNEIYREIRFSLSKGKLVYFTGTGCQVAGLKLFLLKDYDNLICSDILCHGTPNQSVFDYVVKELERKYNGKLENYNFRDKTVNGWSCSSSSSSIRINGKLKYVGFDPIMVSYFNAFISGCMNREVCYRCPFAKDRRTGDITLGDFWGVEKYMSIKNRRDGVSAILINTAKGKSVFDEIKHDLSYQDAEIKDIAVINETLRHPTPRPSSRNLFFKEFKEDPQNALLKFQGNIGRAEKVYKIKKFAQSNIILKWIYRFLINLNH